MVGGAVEALAATAWFWTFSAGFIASIIVSIIMLFCPTLRWILLIYAAWIWYDRKSCERGGRPSSWVRDGLWWKLVKFYFRHNLVKPEAAKFDPKRNYLFACFPHGIFPVGPFASFVVDTGTAFPQHKTYLTALGMQFWLPFIRELYLAVGSVSVSAPALKYLLGDEKGGNIVSLLIGGGEEAKYTAPGKYKIILNKRKGFVKLALQTGSPLVPVISFGETDVFEQLNFPGLDGVRELAQTSLGLGLVLPKGSFLICPRRVPVVTVVGNPVDVQRVEQPTGEQIDSLHQKFVEELKGLFEDNKSRYVSNPETTFLEIV